MNSKESDSSEEYEVTCILPRPKRLQLEAQAAKRGVELGELVRRALKRAEKNQAFADSASRKALEISRVRYSECQNDWHLWPKSLNKSVVVGYILNAIEEQIGEIMLLEMRPEELDAVELICRLRGISYEEFFHQANEWRYMEGEAGDEGDHDQEDEADWWKKDRSQ